MRDIFKKKKQRTSQQKGQRHAAGGGSVWKQRRTSLPPSTQIGNPIPPGDDTERQPPLKLATCPPSFSRFQIATHSHSPTSPTSRQNIIGQRIREGQFNVSLTLSLPSGVPPPIRSGLPGQTGTCRPAISSIGR